MALNNFTTLNNLNRPLINNGSVAKKEEAQEKTAAKTDTNKEIAPKTTTKNTVSYDAEYKFQDTPQTTSKETTIAKPNSTTATTATNATNATTATSTIHEFNTLDEAKTYFRSLIDPVFESGDIEHPYTGMEDPKSASTYCMSLVVKVGEQEYELSNYFSAGGYIGCGFKKENICVEKLTPKNNTPPMECAASDTYLSRLNDIYGEDVYENFMKNGVCHRYDDPQHNAFGVIDKIMKHAIAKGDLQSPATVTYRDSEKSVYTYQGKNLYYERTITSKFYTTDEGLTVSTSNSVGGLGQWTGYLVDEDGNKYQRIDGKIVPVEQPKEKRYKFPDLIDMNQDKKDMEAKAKENKMTETQTKGVYSQKLANGKTVYYVWNSNDKQFERKNDIASITNDKGGYTDRNGVKHSTYNDQWIQAHALGYTPTVEEGLFFKDGVYYDYNEATGKFELVDVSLYEVVDDVDNADDVNNFDKKNDDKKPQITNDTLKTNINTEKIQIADKIQINDKIAAVESNLLNKNIKFTRLN